MNKAFHIFFFFFSLCMASLKINAQTTGVLYGTTQLGGTGIGNLLSYDPLNFTEASAVNFSAVKGYYPNGNVIQASNGLLYGLTYTGGSNHHGTLFYYDVEQNKDSVLINFNTPAEASPLGSLVQVNDSMLYGMSDSGGTFNEGTLFSYNILTNKDSVLVSFADTNGKYPSGNLIKDTNGLLYGMTPLGGSNGTGVLFSYNLLTGKDSVLINFTGANGSTPYGSLMLAKNGLLYGMTRFGGGSGAGVIFSYNPVTGKDTVWVNFNGINGSYPYGSLMQAANGLLYGMTYQGGTSNQGTLFSFSPSTGTYTLLVSLNGTNGQYPHNSLIQASNGYLYGMTFRGGTSDNGILFRYDTLTGVDTVLVNFSGINGAYPLADLTEAMSYSITGNDTLKCYGDSAGWAKITTRGAKMPVHFLWSNGATTDSVGNLKGGAFTCKVSDSAGITFNVPVNIIQPGMLVASPFTNNTCSGYNGSAWVTPVGGTGPYTFLWNNGSTTDTINGLSPGKDTCVVTDSHGCSASGVSVIAGASPLKIDSIVTTPTSCSWCTDGTAKVYVSGGIPPGDPAAYSYLWTYGGDTAFADSIPAGYDAVCVTSTYGCGSVCDSGFVVTGITELPITNYQLKLYPNPSAGNVNIALQGMGLEAITITDELGRNVYDKALDPGKVGYKLTIDFQENRNGVYIVQLLTKQGIITKKLLLVH